MAGLLFRKKKCLEVRFERVQRGFLSERKRKLIYVEGSGAGKAQEPADGKSGMRVWRL